MEQFCFGVEVIRFLTSDSCIDSVTSNGEIGFWGWRMGRCAWYTNQTCFCLVYFQSHSVYAYLLKQASILKINNT